MSLVPVAVFHISKWKEKKGGGVKKDFLFFFLLPWHQSSSVSVATLPTVTAWKDLELTGELGRCGPNLVTLLSYFRSV